MIHKKIIQKMFQFNLLIWALKIQKIANMTE